MSGERSRGRGDKLTLLSAESDEAGSHDPEIIT